MQKNTEIRYLECYAKELLERAFPDQYSQIFIPDKQSVPDLQMNPDYGIEVIWATHRGQRQANEILDEIKGQKINELDPIYSSEIKQIKAELITSSDGNIIGYDLNQGNIIHDLDLLRAYQQKKETARDFWGNTLDLFVFPPLAQIDGWLGEEIIKGFFSVVHDDETNPFHNIIVYEEPTVYLFDTKRNHVQSCKLETDAVEHSKKTANAYSGWSERNKITGKPILNTEKKPTLFISYNHGSRRTANILAQRLKNVADVIWDDKLGNWRRFSLFMNSIRKQDYVACIISDAYLKSENCMYEAMQLMADKNWDEKAMFIVEDSVRSMFYHYEFIIRYIDYWGNEESKIDEELSRHDSAAQKILKEQKEKYRQIKWLIQDFIKTIADLKNPEPENAIYAKISSPFQGIALYDDQGKSTLPGTRVTKP